MIDYLDYYKYKWFILNLIYDITINNKKFLILYLCKKQKSYIKAFNHE